jgi:hypothetical protein
MHVSRFSYSSPGMADKPTLRSKSHSGLPTSPGTGPTVQPAFAGQISSMYASVWEFRSQTCCPTTSTHESLHNNGIAENLKTVRGRRVNFRQSHDTSNVFESKTKSEPPAVYKSGIRLLAAHTLYSKC